MNSLKMVKILLLYFF